MDKKKKNIIMIVAVSIIVITFFSFSYAALTFRSTSFNQQLVLGDIWMKYDEVKGLTIEDAVPGSDYSNYFEFTISGKNTYTKKDIYYDFILNRGDIPTNKTESNRIPDKYLKFKLVSVDSNNQETVIFTDKTYVSLGNQRIHVETIEKNTTSEVNKKYRLYMTIDNSLLIGNTSDAVFTFSEYENAFGSVKLNVTGDFEEKELPRYLLNEFKSELLRRTNSYILEDDIYYVSGIKDDNNPNTLSDIDFNYVWYSGKLWRITAIYPDGRIKMTTDDMITSIAYGEDYNFYTNETTTSWIYQWLNEDFLDTLYNYENIIKTDATWNVTSGIGEVSAKLAETTMVPAKVGLLNSYEYYMSYRNTNYSNGYLNIGYNWWLSNPYNSTSSSDVWSVSYTGYALNYIPSRDMNGVRPVVNLQSIIQLAGGTGTKTDPYKIKGDKEESVPNTTQLNTRSSGEYVNFDGEVYRIVGIENDTTKINKVDYVRDDSDVVINKNFASTYNFGLDTNTQSEDYWDYYLNNTWYNSISLNYKSMLEKGIYYLGALDSPYNYKKTICVSSSNAVSIKDCAKTTSTWSGYVGLPRYGEMFSTQIGNVSTATTIWLITPYTTLLVRNVLGSGYVSGNYSSSNAYGARPSINIKSEIVIKSGSGTEQNPFEIGLPN